MSRHFCWRTDTPQSNPFFEAEVVSDLPVKRGGGRMTYVFEAAAMTRLYVGHDSVRQVDGGWKM